MEVWVGPEGLVNCARGESLVLRTSKYKTDPKRGGRAGCWRGDSITGGRNSPTAATAVCVRLRAISPLNVNSVQCGQR
jgi:hypothetical protein